MNNISTSVDFTNTSLIYQDQDIQQSIVSSALAQSAVNAITPEELSQMQSVSGIFPFDDSTWGSMSKEELTLVFWAILSYLHNIC